MKRAVRRPVRSAFAEFLFGMLAGVCLSMWLSSSYFFLESSTPPQQVAFNEHVTTTPRTEWTPKPRLPGFKTPNILCIVTETYNSKVDPRVVNVTWGARCDTLYFVKRNEYGFPSPPVNLPAQPYSARDLQSWELLRQVFAYDYQPTNFDYAMIVEDKTYAVPDNVRYEFRSERPGEEPMFWGRKLQGEEDVLMPHAYVLSRHTLSCLRAKLVEGKCAADKMDRHGNKALAQCLRKECRVTPRSDLDHDGKHQIMGDPFSLLDKTEVPAHLLPGAECCSVLPLAFMDVGRNVGVRTGTFSYHYYFDYFIRDTAVYGREHMRPLNGVDAGVGKPQIGF